MKKLLIYGASGSIGSQTLELIKNKELNYKLVAVSVGQKIVKIPLILKDFPTVKYICVQKEEDIFELHRKFPKVKFFSGDDGLIELLEASKPDFVVNALVGFVGVAPTIETIKANIDIALANKESLVAAGELIDRALSRSKSILFPIDSEHVAIAKCLQNRNKKEVRRIVLTCSGGPFLGKKFNKLTKVKAKEAVKHPNWSMGYKISIDSATLLNKVFEQIEAYYLFKNYTTNIDVVIHKESIVHSLVQFVDGTYIADIGDHDMKNPIQYALTENLIKPRDVMFNIEDVKNLTFERADNERQKVLDIAKIVLNKKGNTGAILVAADDVLVDYYLRDKIGFLDIFTYLMKALKGVKYIENPTLKQIYFTKNETILYLKKLFEKESKL